MPFSVLKKYIQRPIEKLTWLLVFGNKKTWEPKSDVYILEKQIEYFLIFKGQRQKRNLFPNKKPISYSTKKKPIS